MVYHCTLEEDLFLLIPFFLCVFYKVICWLNDRRRKKKAKPVKSGILKEYKQKDSFLYYKVIVLFLSTVATLWILFFFLFQIKFLMTFYVYLLMFGILYLFRLLVTVLKNYRQESKIGTETIKNYMQLLLSLYPMFCFYVLNEMNSSFINGMVDHPTLNMSLVMVWLTFRMIYLLFGSLSLTIILLAMISKSSFYQKQKRKIKQWFVFFHQFLKERYFLDYLFCYSKNDQKTGIFVFLEAIVDVVFMILVFSVSTLSYLVSLPIKFFLQIFKSWYQQFLFNQRLFMYKLFHYVVLISFIIHYLSFLSSHLSEEFSLAMLLYSSLATVLIIPIVLSKIQLFQEELRVKN